MRSGQCRVCRSPQSPEYPPGYGFDLGIEGVAFSAFGLDQFGTTGVGFDLSPLPRGNGERILLVEDEKPLMLLAEEMLAALSYEPAGFTRAAEVLAEFRADPWRFDMVALDHLIPGMTGFDLSTHLRMARSDIPIVLISGYTGPLLNQEALPAGIDEILTKPLDFRQLAEAMARVLTRVDVR